MKVPARCNKRSCQARRNLSRPLEEYVRRPKCHVPGCGGLMYVDGYRKRKGPKDHPPECTDPACLFARDYYKPGGGVLKRHRVSNKGCSGYDDWKLERSLAASRHCPNKPDSGDEAPF